jgi:alanyl-tRNA synthetase
MTIKAEDIRKSFVDYFKGKDHKEIVSSPVIPFDDPTILFINAGMNQFKDIFTGKRRAEFSRAVTVQKCMRAGGKHNDLENVGRTGRHHTFFEMLGNFSFGDYFKEEAIKFGWEWVTKVLQLPVDRLYATVYEEDDEAFHLWEKIAPELSNGRILRFGKESNYWAMGEFGPNGSSSEIHYDKGVEYSCGKSSCTVNCDCDRYCEIWNLVFMQYNTRPDGVIEPLPKPSVDTGAGLERIASILQGVHSNYETDLFVPILEHISVLCNKKYSSDEKGISHRVIADHLRALTFCIADGGGLSNEKQGYVLRRILRRAARHGRLLNMHEPFIYKLAPTLINIMGSAYPEIKKRQEHIENVILSEEESFGRTLDNGLTLFDDIAHGMKSSGRAIISGEEIFKLYDTFGFPVDLTAIMAREKGLALDMAGFDAAMAEQQEKARQSSQFDATLGKETQSVIDVLQKLPEARAYRTEFVRGDFFVNTQIIDIFQIPGQSNDRLAIIPEKSTFYVEAGGQTGDIGTIRRDLFKAKVTALLKFEDALIHLCDITEKGYNSLSQLKGTSAKFSINEERRWDIMRNHTATHLLHAALRKVLGEHVHQSGSFVGQDKLRFDFSHFKAMTKKEIRQIEQMVNEKILSGSPVLTIEDDLEKAKKSGAMAIFGEKYGSKVRVVSVNDFSKELCGGTHVDIVSQIGPFIVTLEAGIASGVRRIEGITGRAALQKIMEQKEMLESISLIVNRPEEQATMAIEELSRRVIELEKDNKRLKSEKYAGGAGSIGNEIKIGSLTLHFHNFGNADSEEMAGWIDSGKSANYPLVSAAIGNVGGKVTYMASASSTANLNIGNLSRDILKEFGGRGGGKENFAQGTAPSSINHDEFFRSLEEKLKKISGQG